MRTFLIILLAACSFFVAGQSYATAGMHRYSIERSLCAGDPHGSFIQHDNEGKEMYAVPVSLFTEEDTDDDYDFSSARKKILTQDNHLGFTDNLFRNTAVEQPVPYFSFCKNFCCRSTALYIMQSVFRI